MRTEEVKIYQWNELSEQAQERAINEYLQDTWNDRLKNAQDYVITELNNRFPMSDLDILFNVTDDYNYREQVNIYGFLNLTELVDKLEMFTADERARLKLIIKITENHTHRLPLNGNTYETIIDYNSIYDAVVYGITNDNDKENILCDKDIQLIDTFSIQGSDYMEKLSNLFYNTVYDMVNTDDIDMDEISDSNEWEYYENGSFYRG